MPTIRINSQNFDGIPCDIYFTGCTGNTDVITGVTLPYDYTTTDYLGYYSIYFPLYDKYCELNISCPSPTPTPTMTVTPSNTPTQTPTNTPTPTLTPTNTPTPSGVSFDPDAAAYLADVITSGGTIDATISGATDTLFKDLKSNGFYNDMLFMYPFVGGVAASHAINATLNKTYDITWFGGVVHNISGTTGNGTNAYGNTKFYLTHLTSFSANTFGKYQFTNIQTGNNEWCEVGVIGQLNNTTNGILLNTYHGIGTQYTNLRNARRSLSVPFATPPADISGCWITTRTGTTASDGVLYRRNITTPYLVELNTIGTSASNEPFLIHNASFGTSPYGSGYSPQGLNFVFGMNKGISSSESATLSTIINTFQTSLGRNTY